MESSEEVASVSPISCGTCALFLLSAVLLHESGALTNYFHRLMERVFSDRGIMGSEKLLLAGGMWIKELQKKAGKQCKASFRCLKEVERQEVSQSFLIRICTLMSSFRVRKIRSKTSTQYRTTPPCYRSIRGNSCVVVQVTSFCGTRGQSMRALRLPCRRRLRYTNF